MNVPFTAHFYSVAWYLLIDHYRKESRYSFIPLGWIDDYNKDQRMLSSEVEDSLAIEHFRQVLSGVGEK